MMGLVSRLLNPGRTRRLDPAPHDDYWYGPVGRQTSSGVAVDEGVALTYSAVWAATIVVSSTVARVPLLVYKRRGDNGRDRDRAHPAYSLLHRRPNPDSPSMAFRALMTRWQVNWGNAYAEIERSPLGDPVNLWPIHPSRVEIEYDDRRRIAYSVKNPDGSRTPIRSENMIHVPAVVNDGTRGVGVIDVARESIGTALATERYGSTFFKNGGRPGGVLKHPGELGDEARERLRRDWAAMHEGAANANRTAILEDGLDYHALDVPPEDAQFLQSRQHSVTDVSRWYNIPPHTINDLSRATFSNIEQQARDFIDRVIPWMVLQEQEYSRKLLRPDEQETHYVEHLLAGLLRGDAAARGAFYAQMFGLGVMSPNEIREAENLNPLGPEGDDHFVPLNLGKLGEEPEPEPAPAPQPFVEDEPEADDEPEAETEDDEPPPADDEDLSARTVLVDRERALSSLRGLVADAARRLLTKESNAAARAAREPGAFLSWLDEFYGRHEPQLAEALAPACDACAAFGLPGDGGALAAAWVARSRDDLLAACECSPQELESSVGRAVAAWAERPREIAHAATQGEV